MHAVFSSLKVWPVFVYQNIKMLVHKNFLAVCKNFCIKISILSTRSYYFDIQYRIRIVYHFNLFVMLKLGIYLVFNWKFGVSQCWRYYFYLKEFNLVSTSKEYIIWSELLHSHKWLVDLWYFCKMKMSQ